MRIKRVSVNEVTVYLTNRDLLDFDLTHNDSVPSPSELHKFIYDIMEVIRSETGFDPYNGGQVMVEAFHSPNGLKLNISKIAILKQQKKITKEQFDNAKGVKVVTRDKQNILSQKEFLNLLDQIGLHPDIIKVPDSKPSKQTFIFESFKNLEALLCVLDEESLKNCALYRNKKEYAIITTLKNTDKAYNTFIEFSNIHKSGYFLAADISEGWEKINHGEKLAEMAAAVRNMQ